MFVESIKSEYNRYKTSTELALNQINEEDLSEIFGEEGNSISIIMNHLIGNLKSRFTNFLTEDGENPGRIEILNLKAKTFLKKFCYRVGMKPSQFCLIN